MVELKPALNYEEQIEHLIKAHNPFIDDKEKAIRTLKRVNYYRLSAYGIWLTQKDDREKYMEVSHISGTFLFYTLKGH